MKDFSFANRADSYDTGFEARALARVLKPQGILHIVELRLPDSSPLRGVQRRPSLDLGAAHRHRRVRPLNL